MMFTGFSLNILAVGIMIDNFLNTRQKIFVKENQLKTEKNLFRESLSRAVFWCMAVVMSLNLKCRLSIKAFLPFYMVKYYNADIIQIGQQAAIIFFISMLFILMFTFLKAKFNINFYLVFVLCIVFGLVGNAIFSIIVVPFGWPLLVVSIFFGVFVSYHCTRLSVLIRFFLF